MKLRESLPIAAFLLTVVAICLEAAPPKRHMLGDHMLPFGDRTVAEWKRTLGQSNKGALTRRPLQAMPGPPKMPWLPVYSDPTDHRNVNEWKKTHGWGDKVFASQKTKLKECKKLLAQAEGIEVSKAAINDTEFLDDILLTPEQVNSCVTKLNSELSGKRRRKRKMLDFTIWPSAKWNLPIPYQLEGTHTSVETSIIKLAIEHWERETCIRFEELQGDFTKPHLLITRDDNGCWSYIGYSGNIPQQLNLGPRCASDLGTPVHELGHAIGFWHEQSRTDRDDYVSIQWENIPSGYESNFAIARYIDNHTITYDLGSVMHYGSTAFGSGSITIAPTNELYKQTYGQRNMLSFFDTKLVNQVYCDGICGTTSPPCQRGGYPNPNDCNTCKCPEGFGGNYCERVQESDPGCSPYVNSPIKVTDAIQCVNSTGYSQNNYPVGSRCNWLLQAPDGCSVEGSFQDAFNLPCGWNDACQHWVEIKYKSDLQLRGPRFCCNPRPVKTIKSEGSEMAVVFRSDTLYTENGQNGFNFCFKLASGCQAGKQLCFQWSNSTGCLVKKGGTGCGKSRQVRLCYLDLERTICRWERQVTKCKRKCKLCRKCTKTCCEQPEKKKTRRFTIDCSKGIHKKVKNLATFLSYNPEEELPQPTEWTDIPAKSSKKAKKMASGASQEEEEEDDDDNFTASAFSRPV